MKYYIATKLENHAAHNRLRDAMARREHEITYDWTAHGAVYGSGLDVIREVACAEMKGVLDASLVIVLWPGGRGTHVEMGAAIARGIPVLLVTDVPGHHSPSPETCAFYHHPGVTLAQDVREALYLVDDLFSGPAEDPRDCIRVMEHYKDRLELEVDGTKLNLDLVDSGDKTTVRICQPGGRALLVQGDCSNSLQLHIGRR